MDKLFERLNEYGADINGAMGRFLDDVDLYKTCFKTFLADKDFSKLGEALKANDYEEAFNCAHTLKGITGNMALTPLYVQICEMLEKLRKKTYDGIEEQYKGIMEQFEILSSMEE